MFAYSTADSRLNQKVNLWGSKSSNFSNILWSDVLPPMYCTPNVLYQCTTPNVLYQCTTPNVLYQCTTPNVLYQCTTPNVLYQCTTPNVLYQCTVPMYLPMYCLLPMYYNQCTTSNVLYQWSYVPMYSILCTTISANVLPTINKCTNHHYQRYWFRPCTTNVQSLTVCTTPNVLYQVLPPMYCTNVLYQCTYQCTTPNVLYQCTTPYATNVTPCRHHCVFTIIHNTPTCTETNFPMNMVLGPICMYLGLSPTSSNVLALCFLVMYQLLMCTGNGDPSVHTTHDLDIQYIRNRKAKRNEKCNPKK